MDNTIVGFTEFESNGHIDYFYVHHEYLGCGIGSSIMAEVFKS
ncbi:MAG: GNAT family N-acetyltransferase [Legionella sp.]|nr:GNAT family N-acetyltransferase [Legionella sp.]